MIYEQKRIHELSLIELVQAVQSRIMADPIPADQQQPLLQITADILQTCERTTAQLLLRRDMQEIRGQDHVKRALEVAAAGGHHILLAGPRGAGKRMLAQALPSILPPTAVPSPFRSPHFSSERAAFIGEKLHPGELALAHGGVLFLEELSSFDVPQLAALRQAVEMHMVAVSEAVTYPAHFLLVATMRPCPCGFCSDLVRECTCSAEAIFQHRQRIEEIVDTCFDIQVEVPIIREDLVKMRPGESSASIRQRVEAARTRQHRRYAEVTHLWVNADVQSVNGAQQYCEVDSSGEKLLTAARQQLHFTPLHRVHTLRVARTIADLAGEDAIRANHIAEAIQYWPRSGR